MLTAWVFGPTTVEVRESVCVSAFFVYSRISAQPDDHEYNEIYVVSRVSVSDVRSGPRAPIASEIIVHSIDSD